MAETARKSRKRVRHMREIPGQVREIMETLERAGYEAWCVGGAVRDRLLGREPGDWDVTTNALPETVLALFGKRAIPTGLQHGTVTVDGGRGVEVTTYRRDGEYLDNRHPEHVEFTGSLREDLARRDFTVNAIAMDLRGELCDPFGGQEDLRRGLIRAVGAADDRFGEDALRIMRGLRFSARLGFAIEEKTAAAMHGCRQLLRNIAPERLRTELTGLLCGEYAREVLLTYPDVLGVFLPEVLPCVGFDQRSRYHCYDVWEHTAHTVAAAPAEPVLRYTMLFHDIGKPDTFTLDDDGQGHFYGHCKRSGQLADGIMQRLRFDNRSRKLIALLVEQHDVPLHESDRAVRRMLAKYGEEALRLLLQVKRADNLGQTEEFRGRLADIDRWEKLMEEVLQAESCFSLKDLTVKGNDLITLGIKGKAVGAALDRLLELVVDGDLSNDREALLRHVKENLL